MARLSIDSPLGPLMLTGDGSALTAVGWGRFDRDEPDAVLAETARQLDAYFTGRLQRFDLPLKPAGTAFRRSVWEAMLAIPYGGTATYGGMATMLGSGPRAVGGACGANPIPIVIPCHRVLASGGAPGGYSGHGGLDTKAWLLALERRHAGVGQGNGAAAEQFALL
ncbi:cysteine methyltransferase [Azospirillum palustre]|uniref:Methylated-DNA--protein-cysteine methyltransferase n=1 Tax=Azospirillum palustre TaxID=2044885 RepID=A0A2B8BCB2_9PROT|nr:methylated-DNA--[protein]-cysteine S-methyltransferase [Azospirillum palustre]PGH54887.1 cysteine methyltransferase [Azospirillum palustre]